jgi:hypothetical protein
VLTAGDTWVGDSQHKFRVRQSGISTYVHFDVDNFDVDMLMYFILDFEEKSLLGAFQCRLCKQMWKKLAMLAFFTPP